MQPNVLWVQPGAWSGWAVSRDENANGIPFATKAQAVEYARAMAEALAPARVRVRNRNGATDIDWWALGGDHARARAAA